MSNKEPVSTVTLRTVRPGMEAEFEKSLKDFFQRSKSVPGQLGVHVVRPLPGSADHDWGILRTFTDEEAKAAFFNSPEFQEWQAVAAGFMEGERRQDTLMGLETWFTLPGSKAIVPPSRLKMGLLSTCGGVVAASAVSVVVGPLIADLGFFPKILVMSVSIASLMTWIVMPLLSRLLKGWLYGASSR